MTGLTRKNQLNIQMFGDFSLSYEGQSLKLAKNMSGKMIHLFLLLLCAKEQGIHRDELIQILYGDCDTGQSSNSFRAMVFRLRKSLISAGLPEGDYITVTNRIYRWDSGSLKVQFDVEDFERAAVQGIAETDPDKRMLLIEQAVQLYQGRFLPDMLSEDWVSTLDARYQALFYPCMKELLKFLRNHGEDEKALSYCNRILPWYPHEEWQGARLDCMIAQKDYSGAEKYYRELENYYHEELGIPPSKELQKRWRLLKESMDYKALDMREMRRQIVSHSASGSPIFCDYSVLAGIYRYMTQVLDRTGMSAYLMLYTITDKNRMPIEKPEVLEDARTALQEAIGITIRRSDLYARYGKNQFLILLLGTTQEGCEVVAKRIRNSFQKINTRKKLDIVHTSGSILDVKPEPNQDADLPMLSLSPEHTAFKGTP